jgi:hypothetical protein
MSADRYALPPYRVIRFIVACGTWMAALVGAVPVTVGFYLTFTGVGYGLMPILLGPVSGVVLAGLMASYAEVLQIISETLMSR